jgi:hypothetical protein
MWCIVMILALKSALGKISENHLYTGKKISKLYQNGFSQAKYFICISQKKTKI